MHRDELKWIWITVWFIAMGAVSHVLVSLKNARTQKIPFSWIDAVILFPVCAFAWMMFTLFAQRVIWQDPMLLWLSWWMWAFMWIVWLNRLWNYWTSWLQNRWWNVWDALLKDYNNDWWNKESNK